MTHPSKRQFGYESSTGNGKARRWPPTSRFPHQNETSSAWGEKNATSSGTDDATTILPKSWSSLLVKSSSMMRAMLGVTVVLYVMNQSHLLPRPLSSIVSKTLFWPTLPITVGRRIGKWQTVIDDTVLMGGAPFGFARMPEQLQEQYGVGGVVNLCEEYRGPEKSYKKLGMEQLWLPTPDHFVPSVEDLSKAVDFIQTQKSQGKRVYVHCRAGHGRSAAAVFAWLLAKDPTVDRKTLNMELSKLRNVRTTLWKQPNLVEFHSRLLAREKDDEL